MTRHRECACNDAALSRALPLAYTTLTTYTRTRRFSLSRYYAAAICYPLSIGTQPLAHF